ncbi:hypothetical protein [uncultured Microscilla sp.]|uniref:hypothetical protein n=1 Tax=uncultured Microscilla sp. TaxID=432653 RepID=UPI00262AFDB1|nr:hypothetical protein [uncultured Microscilla sp.]
MNPSQKKAYDLLKNNPEELLNSTQYQQAIKKVVAKFCSKGHFNNYSPTDVEAVVKTTLVNTKLAQMQQDYQPQFTIQIKYFERVVFSVCKELCTVELLTV